MVLLTFSLSLFVLASWAWFTNAFIDERDYTIGYVDVDVVPYFVICDGDPSVCEIPATLVELKEDPTKTKPGIYLIVLDSKGSPYFFENFRLKFLVNSSVDTYFRIKIYEQLTLTYLNAESSYTDLTILNNEYMPFDYDFNGWYDSRDIDDYLYYKSPIQRKDIDTPLPIHLINQYELDSFPIYDANYSLQVAFQIEAVQAYKGPKNEWGQEAPPWDYYGDLVNKDNQEIIEVDSSRIYGSYGNFLNFISELLYIGEDDNLYNYLNLVEYTYDDINDIYTKDGTSYEFDGSGNLVSLSSATVIVPNSNIFSNSLTFTSFLNSLLYTNSAGSLLDFTNTIIYTKNITTDIYTDGIDEFVMKIITVWN